jgi:hypothetical protein
MRLKLGVSVLAAARVLDTRLVKDRLRLFEQAHHDYVEAQRRVDAAQSAVDAARVRVLRLHAVQDHAVEDLARALTMDGYRRKNPFTRFGAASPSAIGRLAVADGVDTIELLVDAVLRTKGVSQRTLQAAQSALDAARAVAQALDAVAKLGNGSRDARTRRDAIGRRWDGSLMALRRRARAAGDEGAPDLYATLFPPVRRTARNRNMAAAGAATVL